MAWIVCSWNISGMKGVEGRIGAGGSLEYSLVHGESPYPGKSIGLTVVCYPVYLC